MMDEEFAWPRYWDPWDCTKVWRYWLAPVGCIFHHTLYYVLKNYLVRRVCDPIYVYRRQIPHAASNGVGPPNGNACKPQTCSTGVKGLSEADVSDIALKVVTLVTTIFISAISVYVLCETADDVLKSRSGILVPATHFIIWYFVYDIYAMYDTLYLRKELWREKSLWRRFWIFTKKRMLFIIHHIALFALGYPLVVNGSYWRRDLGDFVIAAFYTREFTNPLLMVAQILKLLHLHHTPFAIVNGFLTAFVFFTTRIANTPLVILYYAYQCHDGNLLSALQALRLVCYICIVLEMALEIFWFLAIARIGVRTLASVAASKSMKKD